MGTMVLNLCAGRGGGRLCLSVILLVCELTGYRNGGE